MTIITRHNLNDIVWFMFQNIPTSGKIYSIDVKISKRSQDLPDIQYYIQDRTNPIFEKFCFMNKDELVKSL